MNTALLFGATAVLTVTGAASLPFLMHRLEGTVAGRTSEAAPTAALAAEDGSALAAPEVA